MNYSSVPKNYAIFLTNTSYGGVYTFQTINQYNSPIPNAQIAIVKSGVTIFNGTTDVNGYVYVALNQLATYSITAGATGYDSISFVYTAGPTTTVSITLLYSGQNATSDPSFQGVYGGVGAYIIPVNGYSTNDSTTVSFYSSSSEGRIVSTNYQMWRTPASPSAPKTLVLNTTSYSPYGINLVNQFINISTGAAHYDLYLVVVADRSGINNSVGSNISNSSDLVTLYAYSGIDLTTPSGPLYNVQRLFNQCSQTTAATCQAAGCTWDPNASTCSGKAPVGGWGWFLVATVCAMIAGGYISRHSVDGAGVIAVLVFGGFALINNAVITAGGMQIDMMMTTGAMMIAVIALIMMRYI